MLDAAGDLPVTFRTLDLGGDKVLPYLEAEREEQPGAGLARRSAWGWIARRCCACSSAP